MLAYLLFYKYNNKLCIAPARSLLSHEVEGVRRVLGAAHLELHTGGAGVMSSVVTGEGRQGFKRVQIVTAGFSSHLVLQLLLK